MKMKTSIVMIENNGKKYLEVEFLKGCTLKNAIEDLIQIGKTGEMKYCGTFNAHRLYSDEITLDSAYLEITGKAYSDF